MIAHKKMNPTLKAKWLKALRSGEYKQGREVMRQTILDGDECVFCCLGVLADINHADEWSDNTETGVSSIRGKDTYPSILPVRTETALAHMNDIGDSFETIADWIEVNL
mgnify:CR=1 FL=1